MSSAKRKLLERVPLFAGLRGRDLEEIERLVDEVDLRERVELTRQGTTGQEFFIIVEGAVRVERDGRLLNRLGPGDFLGEIALIDGKPRMATVTTEEPSRLLVVGHREFHSLLDRRPGVRLKVLEALAERIRNNEPDAAAG